MQLLIHAESSDPALQMLLKVIDLLASCSEGENLFIESICQNVLGISELLKVITLNTDICIIVNNILFKDFIYTSTRSNSKKAFCTIFTLGIYENRR